MEPTRLSIGELKLIIGAGLGVECRVVLRAKYFSLTVLFR